MTVVAIVEILVHTLKDGSIFASVLGTIGFTLAFTAGVMYVIQDSLGLSLQLRDVLIYARGMLGLTGHRRQFTGGTVVELNRQRVR